MSEADLTERAYEEVADRTLRALERAIGEVEADLEVDLESGILTIELEGGLKYVINSHRAARQIWMAAERSAWHFDYRAADGLWISTRTGEELWAALEAVLSRKLGRAVTLAR